MGGVTGRRTGGTTNRRTDTVSLSRTQTKVLADKLDPLVKAHSSREKAAQAMGIKAHVIQYICSRRAMLSIPKEDFVRLTEMLGVDVSKWDLARY